MSSSSSSIESLADVSEESVGSQRGSSSSSTSMIQFDDASASKNSSNEITLSDPPRKTEYDWVTFKVTEKEMIGKDFNSIVIMKIILKRFGETKINQIWFCNHEYLIIQKIKTWLKK